MDGERVAYMQVKPQASSEFNAPKPLLADSYSSISGQRTTDEYTIR